MEANAQKSLRHLDYSRLAKLKLHVTTLNTMSPERQYNEQEVAAIFEHAAAGQEAAQRQLPRGGGLSLVELEQIGKEAGITPEYIARAAAAIERTGPIPPPTTYFGFPVSVARTVDLPGPLSDQEWDRLVADLRETFQATGEVRSEGSLRQWRNGNLHALIEPTDSGHRLSLRYPERQRAQRSGRWTRLLRDEPRVYVGLGRLCRDGSRYVAAGRAECDWTRHDGACCLSAARLEGGAGSPDGGNCRARP